MRINSCRACLISVVLAANVHASMMISNDKFSGCVPSKEYNDKHKPEFYPTHNNLIKTTSGIKNDYAERILLRGIVVDKNCLPISDASVKIWQQDEYGDYRYVKDQEVMYREVKGVGKSYSNNNGKFAFITVQPAKYTKKKSGKYISISVSHRDFPTFETKILLDRQLTSFNARGRQFVIAELNKSDSARYGVELYDFKVVVNANIKHRKY